MKRIHRQDDDQTDKMDHHHNPSGKKWGGSGITTLSATTRPRMMRLWLQYMTLHISWHPASWCSSGLSPGPQYVYDPQVSGGSQGPGASVCQQTQSPFWSWDQCSFSMKFIEEVLASTWRAQGRLTSTSWTSTLIIRFNNNEGADEYFSADNLYTPFGNLNTFSEKQSLYENPRNQIHVKGTLQR